MGLSRRETSQKSKNTMSEKKTEFRVKSKDLLNKIKELICIGNVVITQGENASYSDRAIYKAQEQRVILSGRPKIIFYTPEDEEGAF